MFTRNLRKLFPSSYRVIKSTSVQFVRQWPFRSPPKCTPTRTPPFLKFTDTKPQMSPSTIISQRSYSEQQPTNPDIGAAAIVDYEDVRKATVDSNILIVDVREPNEVQEHGKIPNSINIPLGNVTDVLNMSQKDFLEAFKKPKPSEDSDIIFYCMIGKRSAKAQQRALGLGFKNAKNYLGSWTDWANRQK